MTQSWPDTAKYRPNTSPIHLTGRKTSKKSSLRRKFSRLGAIFASGGACGGPASLKKGTPYPRYMRGGYRGECGGLPHSCINNAPGELLLETAKIFFVCGGLPLAG